MSVASEKQSGRTKFEVNRRQNQIRGKGVGSKEGKGEGGRKYQRRLGRFSRNCLGEALGGFR